MTCAVRHRPAFRAGALDPTAAGRPAVDRRFPDRLQLGRAEQQSPHLSPDASHIAYCDLGSLRIEGLQPAPALVYDGCRSKVGWISPTELLTLDEGYLWRLFVDERAFLIDEGVDDLAIAGAFD